jgi:hypothetical protein
MGNFGSTIFGVDANLNFSKLTNTTMQNIAAQCGTGNTQAVKIENVEIKIKNLDCSGNVCVFVQSTNQDITCVSNVALQSISTIMATQAAGSQTTGAAGGVNGKLTLAGANININGSDTKNKITETISQVCGTGNTVVDKFDDVEVDMGRVKCDNFSILQQNSNLSVYCYMKATAQAYANNTVLQGAGD